MDLNSRESPRVSKDLKIITSLFGNLKLFEDYNDAFSKTSKNEDQTLVSSQEHKSVLTRSNRIAFRFRTLGL